MRKVALLLAIAVAAAAPSAAYAKKAKAAPKPKVYDTTAANQNESGARLLRDGIWNLALRGPAWSSLVSK